MAIDLHQWAVPTINRETCAVCGQCVKVCPAKTLVLFHQDAMADAGDGYIAATYAMLAAESLGLGSCMIGIALAMGKGA